MVQVGCCGWQKAHDTYYQHFSLIEVQKTFYKPPMVKTARRWREDEALDQLQAWCDSFDDAYVLFNNVSMWDDALRFQEALSAE